MSSGWLGATTCIACFIACACGGSHGRDATFLKPCINAKVADGPNRGCSAALECSCAGCTVECLADDDCADYSTHAVCTNSVIYGCYTGRDDGKGECQVPCSTDADCRHSDLGDAYACGDHYCYLADQDAAR